MAIAMSKAKDVRFNGLNKKTPAHIKQLEANLADAERELKKLTTRQEPKYLIEEAKHDVADARRMLARARSSANDVFPIPEAKIAKCGGSVEGAKDYESERETASHRLVFRGGKWVLYKKDSDGGLMPAGEYDTEGQGMKALKQKANDAEEFKQGDKVTTDVTPQVGVVLSVEGTGDKAKVLVRFGKPDKYGVSDVRKLYAHLLRKNGRATDVAPIPVRGRDSATQRWSSTRGTRDVGKLMSQYRVDPNDSHIFIRNPNRRESVCKTCGKGESAEIHKSPFTAKDIARDHANGASAAEISAQRGIAFDAVLSVLRRGTAYDAAKDVEGYTDGSGFHPISGSKGYRPSKTASGKGHGPKRKKKRKARDVAPVGDWVGEKRLSRQEVNEIDAKYPKMTPVLSYYLGYPNGGPKNAYETGKKFGVSPEAVLKEADAHGDWYTPRFNAAIAARKARDVMPVGNFKIGDPVDIRGNKGVGVVTKVLSMPKTGVYYEVKIDGRAAREYYKPSELTTQANDVMPV